MKKFLVVKVVSRPFGRQVRRTNGWAHAKCSLCDNFQYIVAKPQFCITQCLECFPPKECHGIPERFQDFPRAYVSGCIPLSGPAAGARPLYDILEMLETLWLQSAKKTVEGWPVQFT